MAALSNEWMLSGGLWSLTQLRLVSAVLQTEESTLIYSWKEAISICTIIGIGARSNRKRTFTPSKTGYLNMLPMLGIGGCFGPREGTWAIRVNMYKKAIRSASYGEEDFHLSYGGLA